MTSPSGAVYRLPAPPKSEYAAPGTACPRERLPGTNKQLMGPPTPGLRARRRPGSILVTFSFRGSPHGCNADVVKLTIDFSGDTLPGFESEVPVRHLRQTVRMKVPADLPRPDVARATAFTEDRLASKAVGVRIADP